LYNFIGIETQHARHVNLPFLLYRFPTVYTGKIQNRRIQVIVQDERHISKCSSLDLEPIGKHAQYCARRVIHADFIPAQGQPIQADVNGSYNILRKALPSAFRVGYRAL
jgi:putative transposase